MEILEELGLQANAVTMVALEPLVPLDPLVRVAEQVPQVQLVLRDSMVEMAGLVPLESPGELVLQDLQDHVDLPVTQVVMEDLVMMEELVPLAELVLLVLLVGMVIMAALGQLVSFYPCWGN